jgi:four helix bundle protein
MSEPRNQGTLEPGYSYRNLALWQEAQDFAREVVQLVDSLPSVRSADTIGRQVIRSATSVPANIAEGHGRFGLASYRNHLSIAKGSACETDSWLDLMRGLSMISGERERDLHTRCSALIAALTRRIRDLERMASKAVKDERAPYDSLSDVDEEVEPRGSGVPRFQGSSR